MSNFYRITKHPVTGKFERADWIDGRGHNYTIWFSDGSVFKEHEHKWEYEDTNEYGDSMDQGETTRLSEEQIRTMIDNIMDEIHSRLTKANNPDIKRRIQHEALSLYRLIDEMDKSDKHQAMWNEINES